MKKRFIVIPLIAALCIAGLFGAGALRKRRAVTAQAETAVQSVLGAVKSQNMDEVGKLCSEKVQNTLQLYDLDAAAYTVYILGGLGYYSADASAAGGTDAGSSAPQRDYESVLSNSDLSDDEKNEVRSIYTALSAGAVSKASVEKDKITVKKDTVTVPVRVSGILNLSDLDFQNAVSTANQAVSDAVTNDLNSYMDAYDVTKASGADAAAATKALVQTKEYDALFPAMLSAVQNAPEKSASWTFTVHVTDGKAAIRSVSVQ